MTLAILHLSDIHIKEASDPVLQRGKKIVAAALGEFGVAIDECHVVVTGDIAQSGATSEFALAKAFFGVIEDEIFSRTGLTPKFVLCPGNHDCDLRGDQSVRQALLGTLGPNHTSDAIAKQLAQPLAAYFHFSEEVTGQRTVEPWFQTTDFKYGGNSISYLSIHASVTSTNPENVGHLFVPVSKLPASQDREIGLSISLLHQPTNWLDPECARNLNEYLESNADLVFLGHEHRDRAIEVVGRYDRSRLTMIHGDVLQERSDATQSAFRTVIIRDASHIKMSRFVLRGDIYEKDEKKSDVDWRSCSNAEVRRSAFAFNQTFLEWTEDTGATFSHRKKQHLVLSDIFVWPNLRETMRTKDPKTVLLDSTITRASDFSDVIRGNSLIFVLGDEQSGKTTLAKRWMISLRNSDLTPLYVPGSEFSSVREPAIVERLEAAIRSQYGAGCVDRFKQLRRQDRAIIIDDFDYINSNNEAKSALLKLLSESFAHIVLLTHNTPGTELLLEQLVGTQSLPPPRVFELLPFSYELRVELIEKWLRIGSEYSLESEQLEATAIQFARLVNDTIGRNLVPAVPIFVLIILQRAESESEIESVIKNGSHGFLYEAMIIQAVSHKVKIFSVNTSMTYLTAFAGALYSSGLDGLEEFDANGFHLSHCDSFDIRCNFARLKDQLVSAGIWSERRGRIVFAYPYLYFYFVARHLTGLQDNTLRLAEVDKLIATIYTERSANILLFLAHLGRDEQIILKLLREADSIFSTNPEFDVFAVSPLLESFGFSRIREIYYEGSRLERLAYFDSHEGALDPEKEVASEANVDFDEVQAVARRLSTAFRTLQVLGQVLRNHVGSIERDRKRQIASSCVSLGLRTLGYTLKLFENLSSELIDSRLEHIRQSVASSPASKTKPELMLQAEESFLSNTLCNVAVGTIAKIANAIGCEDLTPTLDYVLGQSRSTKGLIGVTVRLEHFTSFPESELAKFYDKKLTQQDQFAVAILRRFLLRRFYLFPDRNELKQKLLRAFGIERKPLQARDISQRKLLTRG